MISREPTIERLATARSLLLEPFGLDETHLSRALAAIQAHQVDDADLYFQYTRSEGWSLEEGIVKTGSFSIDQGVGVRAVSGEKTAFAYSDDISLASLMDAAHTVRSIAATGKNAKTKVPARKIAGSRSLYRDDDPIASLDSTAKVQLLERLEQQARAKDTRVVQVMAGLAGEYDVVLVARQDRKLGPLLAADIRPLVRVSITVIVEHNGRREMGSSGGGGRFDYAHFNDERLNQYVNEAVDQALVTLDVVLTKARSWQRWATLPLNERQIKLLNRLLDGFDGKLTSSKWAAIANCSSDTALRDINDLLTLGVLARLEGGGRNTAYILVGGLNNEVHVAKR